MSDPKDQVRATVVVTGKVHGVFFRAAAQSEGMGLGLVGEVRNLPDRSVEAIVEGERGLVEQFVAWCRKGPPMSEVEECSVRWGAARGEFRTFVVAR